MAFFLEIGHHGTYLRNFESINEVGFFESRHHDKWLGDGVYFFINGLKDPLESALQFIEDERFREAGLGNVSIDEDVCVLKVEINVDNDKYIDLDSIQGIELFNSWREEIISKILSEGKKPVNELKDYDLLNKMRDYIGVEFVKKSLFIKFGQQRSLNNKLSSFIPNVTIFVVNNPSYNIHQRSIVKVL